MADSTADRLDAVSPGPVTDTKGAKTLATNSLVNEFHVAGLVITPAGVKVPADKVAAVRDAALHNHVELHELS